MVSGYNRNLVRGRGIHIPAMLSGCETKGKADLKSLGDDMDPSLRFGIPEKRTSSLKHNPFPLDLHFPSNQPPQRLGVGDVLLFQNSRGE
jgi:hypothetical protein